MTVGDAGKTSSCQPSPCEGRRPAARACCLTILVAAAALVAAPAVAQLPYARLDSVFPPGGRIGTQVEVHVQGADLDGVDRLVFSHPGLSAAPKMQPLSELLSESRPVSGVFNVQVSDDIPSGQYEVRAVGDFGISNPRWFHVNASENVTESADNDSPKRATSLAIGTTVSARADGDRIDYYRLSAAAGQRITADCLAQRLDSRMDATLVLYDPTGREIGRARNTHGRDPVLGCVAPADGEYTLAVYDFLYSGGNEYFYRLSLHGGPYVTHVFPPCVPPDVPSQVVAYGYNLPGGEPIEKYEQDRCALEQLKLNLRLPQQSGLLIGNRPGAWLHPRISMLDGWLYQLDSPSGPSNPVFIGTAVAPVVVETEPNDAADEATAVSVPCEFVGQFTERGDRDWISFRAQNGQTLRIEVVSDRLGASTDPVLYVDRVTENAQGQQQVSQVAKLDDTDPAASNDPARPLQSRSGDPIYRLAVDQNATYRVQIRDLYGAPLAGSSMIYRLVIRAEQPDYRLVAFPLPPDRRDRNKVFTSSPILRRGGTLLYEIRCFRQGGFDGEVELTADGLPAGVSCAGARIGPTADRTGFVLVAEEDAPAWTGDIKIVGRATIDGRLVEQTARTAAVVVRSENVRETAWVTRMTQQACLSVIDSETVPATLSIGDGAVLETSIGGRLEVPLRITRRGDFAAAGNAVVQGLPSQVQVKTGPVNNDGGKIELTLASAQIPTGTHTLYARVPIKQKRLRNAVAIAAAAADVKRFQQLVEEKSNLASSVTEAEKAQADQMLKEAQRLTADADKRLNDARNANKEREYTFELVTTPARLVVHATPIRLSAEPSNVVLRRGEKGAVTLGIERRFGFNDKVDVVLALSPQIPGLTAGQVTIAKDHSSGTLEIVATDQVAAGRYDAQLLGRLKFNNVNLDEKLPLIIRIEE